MDKQLAKCRNNEYIKEEGKDKRREYNVHNIWLTMKSIRREKWNKREFKYPKERKNQSKNNRLLEIYFKRTRSIQRQKKGISLIIQKKERKK